MYATYLKYAGGEPFEKEAEREDISHAEYELLTQDETYKRLAELRYIAERVESDIHGDDIVQSSHVDEKLRDADASIATAVDYYVNQWLATHDVEEVEA